MSVDKNTADAILASIIVGFVYVKWLRKSAFLRVPPSWQDRERRTWFEHALFDLGAASVFIFFIWGTT